VLLKGSGLRAFGFVGFVWFVGFLSFCGLLWLLLCIFSALEILCY
jgi:hypothetical protein